MRTENQTISQMLRECRGRPLHVVDPYKIPVNEALEKARAVSELRFPVLLVGSTDYTSFEVYMPSYLAKLKNETDLKLVLHFPPSKGKGFPLSERADGVLCPCVLNSADDYFRGKSLVETKEILDTAKPEPRPELLPSAAFTFGPDEKTFNAVGALPTPDSPSQLYWYTRAIKKIGFEIVYLYSRNAHVTLEVCRFFREHIDPHQLLFVSGGIRSRSQVVSYINAGADYVVFGTALETADWKTVLAEIADPPL